MTAKEFLQNKYPYLKEKRDQHPHIKDEWIAQMMTEYAEQEREKAFNEAREKKDSYWHGADQYIRVDKYEDTEEYKKQNPLI